MIFYVIIACEIGFWVFLGAGLASRYLLDLRKLGAALLVCVLIVDIVLLAAMETSLSVKEAEGMLSELASGGYLLVEPSGGAMTYALPGNEPEDGGR